MKSQSTIVAACLMACLLSGCRTPVATEAEGEGMQFGPFGKMANPMEWGADPDKPRSGTPERVVVTWVDTVRQSQGNPAERGFGGRLYFYDRGADPITVDGRLVVYAFDEQGRASTDHKPTKRFVFPVEQLSRHQSESDIGPSYSVWLPWGSVEGPPTEISLIARFEPVRGGGLVVSDQARQRLPGQGVAPNQSETMIAQQPSTGRVRQAGFVDRPQQEASPTQGGGEEPRKRLSTTTISLRR